MCTFPVVAAEGSVRQSDATELLHVIVYSQVVREKQQFSLSSVWIFAPNYNHCVCSSVCEQPARASRCWCGFVLSSLPLSNIAMSFKSHLPTDFLRHTAEKSWLHFTGLSLADGICLRCAVLSPTSSSTCGGGDAPALFLFFQFRQTHGGTHRSSITMIPPPHCTWASKAPHTHAEKNPKTFDWAHLHLRHVSLCFHSTPSSTHQRWDILTLINSPILLKCKLRCVCACAAGVHTHTHTPPLILAVLISTHIVSLAPFPP